jgi:2-octaprenyl-6-methoxyphenol hydroxylase
LPADNARMTAAASASPERAAQVLDILVAGGGIVGLAFACAVKQASGRRLKVAVVDPGPGEGDGGLRTVALAAGSRSLLARIGAWDALEPLTQPILKMSIFDGGAADAVRLAQLEFEAREGEALAHMAFVDDVVAALRKAAQTHGVEMIRGAAVGFAPGRWAARVDLAEGGSLGARLVVAADGARSKLRTLAEIPTVGWETGQAGIVATIAHQRDHEGRAEQHFLPAGPFAILPLPGRRSSIVWNESVADAKALLALGPAEFLAQLERRFTLKLGGLEVASRIESFPLSFRVARTFVGRRLALIGDAAHLVHPLAGQGLNLGLRDVAALVEAVVKPLRLGLDPGDPATLEDYQRGRRFDVVFNGMGMDAMNRLFSNENAPLRFARDLGLRLVDRAPALKRFFADEAAGAGPGAPRLLRGQGL